jgi:hypothetical protein
MLGAPGADEATFAAVYLVAALAWAPAFYRAVDPWLRRRVGILLGVTIVWRRGGADDGPAAWGWTPDPGVPVGAALEHIVHRFGVVINVLGGAWPVTILVAATLALSVAAPLAIALVLATVAIWSLVRGGAPRLAPAA